jgi:F-type H+-transporting ATPase subunit delta
MKNAAHGVARRYAHALLELGVERGNSQELRQALQASAELVGNHTALRDLLQNPAVPAERKQAVLRAVWPSQDGAEGLVARLLGLLVERGRTELLAAVSAAYALALNAHNKVVAVVARSATALDAAQLQSLKAALEQKTGQAVELASEVDPALLGGLVLELQGRVYDGSVQARLSALRQRLIEGGQRG